jgi:hypothetical protein
MFDSLLFAFEKELMSCVTRLLATARTQLEIATVEIDKERFRGLAVVAEQRAKAVAFVGAKREELEQKSRAMHNHRCRATQEDHVMLNVGGHRFETSVQTLRHVPGNDFDAYFSGRQHQW